MPKLTVSVSEDLSTQLEPYRDNLDDLLRIGLREVKVEQALSLFKQGHMSLWKAARLAGVTLREMTQCAVAQGLRPEFDEDTMREELA